MSDEEMRDELLTLLVAGHETTATSLSWAIERLVRHPEKLERLRAEVLAGGEELPDRDDPGDPAPAPGDLDRPAQADRAGRDRRLRAARRDLGRPLRSTSSTATPRSTPSRERFLPERFLESPPGTYTWIPFGGGVRRCLGASFAQFEMAVVLKELVKRRQIRPANPKPERVFRRAITETPRHNAEVILG